MTLCVIYPYIRASSCRVPRSTSAHNSYTYSLRQATSHLSWEAIPIV